MSSKILFVFEGKNTEKRITDNLKRIFFNDDRTIIQTAYCTTIYNLYKTLSHDLDLDFFEILKKSSSTKEELSLYSRSDFAEIYLFFDYDGHCTSASDKKLQEMLQFFVEETDTGKLFISYPMVEALKHCSQNIDFKNLKVEAKKDINYKKVVNESCDRELINMPKYSKKVWKNLINKHLCKMNFVTNEVFSLPLNNITQEEIFNKQLEKFIQVDSTVAVLSAFPIFLFDYYGYKYIKGLLQQQ